MKRTELRRTAMPPRKTPMRRGSQLRRTAIRPVSKARAAEQRTRVAMLRAVYGEAALCQRCGSAEANDAHEIVPRSAGGSITDPANVRALCRSCHDWIHANPAQATAAGWIRASL